MRVLYVEDDITVAKTVQLMLEGEGYICDTIKSGVRGVALAKKEEYDLILLDVMLPDIDGYEVIKRVREAKIRTPFLIVTGLAPDHKQRADLPMGVSEHLVKPFNKDDLIDRIQGVLSRATREEVDEPVAQPDAGEVSQGAHDDRRQHRRFETTTPAKILHGDGIDCIILNMSYGGAKLQLADAEADVPQVFELQVALGATYRCTVSWRFQDKVGVSAATLKPETFLDVPSDDAGSAPSDDPAPVQSDGAAAPSGQPQTAMDATPTREPAPVEAGGDDPATEQPEPDDGVPVPPTEPQPAMDAPSPREPEPVEAGGNAPPPIPSEPDDTAAIPTGQPQPGMDAPRSREPEPAEAPPDAVEAPGVVQDQNADGQIFVVDQGVCLDAESCECGELLVKGRFQGALRADRLQLVEGGQFVGDATVRLAEIAGAFEGNLIVAGKLVIRATGSVSGSAQYDEIIIEPGGRIAGRVQGALKGSAGVPKAETPAGPDGTPGHGMARSA